MTVLLSTLIGAGAGDEAVDNREFKNYQDWYGYYAGGQGDGHNFATPQSTRDAGNADGGTGTGAQNRRAVDNSTFTWTVPTGVSKVRITCLGGGGGGGHYRSHYYGDAGGSGGGFASGEYNVTAGENLTIFVGRGGWGKYRTTGWGASGQDTYVQAVSGGSGHINVQAGGGGRGYHQTSVDPPGSGTVSGSDLVAGTNLAYTGGRGGYGSPNGFGWGPEGYPSGGGGSCASYKGNGYRGGNGDNGGYSFGAGGGGGIGGRGGDVSGNNSPSNNEFWAAGGGGSNGQGTAWTPSGPQSSYNSKGGDGAGFVTADGGGGYTGQGFKNVAGQGGTPMYNGYNSSNWFYESGGSRYGDGYAAAYNQFSAGGGGGGGANQYEQGFTGSPSGGGATSYPSAKCFNGVLGRLFGGGGAGAPRSDANFGSNCFSGGQGGAGAGGGGAASTETNNQNDYTNWASYNTFSVTDLAWYTNDNKLDANNYRLNGNGGHGGALGGGGGGNSRQGAMGGAGGIGAGGGGCHGHYEPSGEGLSGAGGPGYVLIEW